MKTKILRSISVMFFYFTVFSVLSTNYFVKPDAPSESNGLTWDSAFNIADLISAIGKTVVDGDSVFFAGGTYYPTKTTGIKLQNVSLTLIGGFPANLTGVSTPKLIYPTDTPTILNGDNNSDGVPNAGDVRNAIYIQTTEAAKMAEDRSIVIEGFTVTNCYYAGTSAYETGAICADCTQSVTVRNCIFENNLCENGGGAAFSNSGSKSYLVDCVIKDNKAGDAGAAIRTTNRGAAANHFAPSVTIERSLIANNELTKTGNVAGGSAIRIARGGVWIVNSTIADNKGHQKAAIHMDSGTNLYLSSTTIANNQNSNTGDPKGSAVFATGVATIKLINSLVVGPKGSSEPVVYFENMAGKSSSQFFSDGANVVGLCEFVGGDGFVDDQVDIWDETYDDCNVNNTYEALFGSNILSDNGGFSKTLIPLSHITFYESAWLDGFVSSEYGCPFLVNELVDQRNVTRFVNATVGAYDFETGSSGIDNLTDNYDKSLRTKGNGIFEIDGKVNEIKIFGINGNLILEVKGNTANLSHLPKGVYLLATEGKVFKVIR